MPEILSYQFVNERLAWKVSTTDKQATFLYSMQGTSKYTSRDRFSAAYTGSGQLSGCTLHSKDSQNVCVPFECRVIFITSGGANYHFKYVCKGLNPVNIKLIRESGYQ